MEITGKINVTCGCFDVSSINSTDFMMMEKGNEKYLFIISNGGHVAMLFDVGDKIELIKYEYHITTLCCEALFVKLMRYFAFANDETQFRSMIKRAFKENNDTSLRDMRFKIDMKQAYDYAIRALKLMEEK